MDLVPYITNLDRDPTYNYQSSMRPTNFGHEFSFEVFNRYVNFIVKIPHIYPSLVFEVDLILQP